MSAQILERCVAEMPSAAAYALEQRPILAALYQGFEPLQEGLKRSEGQEGYSISFRYIAEEAAPSRGRMIFFTCGPLVCQLFISGPDGDDPERDRLFEAIGRTFAFRGADALAGAKAGGLITEILRMPQAEAAKGWPGLWRKFPQCCIELPLPNKWDIAVNERGEVAFRRANAEILLHRALGENNDADLWFANRMRRLQERGDKLLGAEKGDIERGSFVAILYEEKGAVRTWKTAAMMRSFNLFLEDQQPLHWTLRSPESEFNNLKPYFESLVAAAHPLVRLEWETRLVEPWLDYTLRGPWQGEGPGLYVNLQETPVFIQLSHLPTKVPLEKLEPVVRESMSHAFKFNEADERVISGSWRQHDALHYAGDGIDPVLREEISIRTVWLMKDDQLYSIFVRGADSDTTETLVRDLLESFSPDAER